MAAFPGPGANIDDPSLGNDGQDSLQLHYKEIGNGLAQVARPVMVQAPDKLPSALSPPG